MFFPRVPRLASRVASRLVHGQGEIAVQFPVSARSPCCRNSAIYGTPGNPKISKDTDGGGTVADDTNLSGQDPGAGDGTGAAASGGILRALGGGVHWALGDQQGQISMG